MVDDELVLVGGVSNECPPPGCTVINLDSKQCAERPLPVSNECVPPGCTVLNLDSKQFPERPLPVSNECPPPGCTVSIFSSRSIRGTGKRQLYRVSLPY